MSIFFWESPGASGSTSCAFALSVSQSSALQQAYFTWGAKIHETAIAIGMGRDDIHLYWVSIEGARLIPFSRVDTD